MPPGEAVALGVLEVGVISEKKVVGFYFLSHPNYINSEVHAYNWLLKQTYYIFRLIFYNALAYLTIRE